MTIRSFALGALSLSFGFGLVSCGSKTASKPAYKSTAAYKTATTSAPTSPLTKSKYAPSHAEAVALASAGRRDHLASQGRLRTIRTTAYSDKENEMGGIYKDLSAAGTKLKYGQLRSAAADWSLYPLGTKFKIIGLPYTYVIDDYGSALVGKEVIDLYKPSLALMNKWGVRHVKIQVMEWGSYSESLTLLNGRLKAAHCRRMANTIRQKTGMVNAGTIRANES